MTSHRKSPRSHLPHLAWLVPCLTRLSWAAALLGFGVVLLFHQPAHAASCVPALDGQEESFGNPYWLSGYYLDSLMHPHPHETYPEVKLTWYQHDADNLTGYKVVAEDAYTTDGSLSTDITTLAKMPLYVTVGKDTRQVRMPNMASQFRTWVVYALFTNGSSQKIASTSLICGQDVRKHRSDDDDDDAPYVYVELVETDGTTHEPKAISYSDWSGNKTGKSCHYDLPDEYARGVNTNEIGGKPAHYPFTDSWNWGSPMVGVLVDDSYDVEGLSYLRACETTKPTAHLAGEWDIEAITFTPGLAVNSIEACKEAHGPEKLCTGLINENQCQPSTAEECVDEHEDDLQSTLCTLDVCVGAHLSDLQSSPTVCTLNVCRDTYEDRTADLCPNLTDEHEADLQSTLCTLNVCVGAHLSDLQSSPTVCTLNVCQTTYQDQTAALCPTLADSLGTCNGELGTCENQRNTCRESLDSCNGNLTDCQNEGECSAWTVEQCQTEYEDDYAGDLCPDLTIDLTECRESLDDGNPPPDVNTPNPPDDGSGGGGGGESRDDHGNTPAQATVVALGAQEPGQIDTADDIDYFTVPLPYAGVLMVETIGSTDTTGTIWQDGVELGMEDHGGIRSNFQLNVPVKAKSVIIAVEGNGTRTGSYTLETALVAGYLENPGANSFQSGIGVLSGWVCDAEIVEIEINGQTHPAAYGTERLDTAGRKDGTVICGDVDNGFGLLFNWNRLGAGEHTVVALVDGVELGRALVTVTTLGAEFLRDAEGECMVDDFPLAGQTTTLEWQQNSQNFVITDVE